MEKKKIIFRFLLITVGLLLASSIAMGQKTGRVYLSGPKMWVETIEEDGKLKSTKFYDKDGNFIYEEESKSLREEIVEKDGIKTHLTYYPDGQLKEELMYRGDKPHGPYKTYHENGQLEQEGSYFNGSLEGLVKIYGEDGNLQLETVFKDGKAIDGKLHNKGNNL